MQNNIGFYIKDKSLNLPRNEKNFTSCRYFSKFIIQIFKKNTLRNNGFDGKNILYSSEKTKFLSLSQYGRQI